MDSREKQEEKNKRVGWLVSVSIQLFLLVLFYFLIAWKAPFPPIPEYGIELGFLASSGAPPQPTTSSDNQSEEDAQIAEETTSENVAEDNLIENEQSDPETETPIVEESEIPVDVKETAGSQSEPEKEVDQQIKIETKTNTENTNVQENPTDNEEQQEEVAEEPKIDDRAIYSNQGTETGSSEGASLALAGWIWDFKPKPNDTSIETGKIVYKIVVDQEGYLVKIETVTSTVSPSVERKYREAVEKLTFSKTSDYKPAPQSSGTLTFIIKAR